MAVSPQIANLIIYQGASWEQEFEFFEPDGVQKFDFTNYRGMGVIKKDAKDVLPVATFLVTFPREGVLKLSLSNETTWGIELRGRGYDVTTNFYYDIVISKDPYDVVERALEGTVKVSPGITKFE